MDKRVGFGPRFLAMLLDGIIVAVASVLLAPIVGGLVGANVAANDAAAGGMAMAMGAVAAAGLISTVYFLIEAFTGWTLGKRILKLQIGNENMQRAATGQLLLRYFVKNIGSIVSLVAGIVGIAMVGTIGSVLGLVVFLGIFMVLGQARQTLHDKIAKTAVWRRNDLVAAPVQNAA
jgi:uncharacterized RDD family membrane protein YckC